MAGTGARSKRGSALVLVGQARPKLRKASRRDWTRAKEDLFLATLTETCNVTRAAEAAGVSLGGAYKRRKGNAAFRASWSDAVASAYQRLELVLLDRAFNGIEKSVTRKDGSTERMREYSNQLGLTLLKMHRDTASEVINEPAPEELDEVRDRVIKKLQRLRKRFEQEDAGQGPATA